MKKTIMAFVAAAIVLFSFEASAQDIWFKTEQSNDVSWNYYVQDEKIRDQPIRGGHSYLQVFVKQTRKSTGQSEQSWATRVYNIEVVGPGQVYLRQTNVANTSPFKLNQNNKAYFQPLFKAIQNKSVVASEILRLMNW